MMHCHSFQNQSEVKVIDKSEAVFAFMISRKAETVKSDTNKYV